MNNFDLYFVGFYKHDGIQCLLSGPYVNFDQAQEACDVFADDYSRSYVVCKTTLPFAVDEV